MSCAAQSKLVVTFPIPSRSSTNPRQLLANLHVNHAAAADGGARHDDARMLLGDAPDDGGACAHRVALHCFQHSVGCVGRHDGDQLAFVGDMHRIHAQHVARGSDSRRQARSRSTFSTVQSLGSEARFGLPSSPS